MVAQINFGALAERFPELLPWPTGGGLLQFFAERLNTRILVHRDLDALRPADAGPAGFVEHRLDPVVRSYFPDHPRDYPPLWAVREKLSPEHRVLLDQWTEQFRPAEQHQIGGGASWMQDAGYWAAWALDHGLDPADLYPGEDDEDPAEYEEKSAAAWQHAEDQALAEGWRLVCQLPLEEYTGMFYLLAPADGAGRWDIDRVRAVFQDD